MTLNHVNTDHLYPCEALKHRTLSIYVYTMTITNMVTQRTSIYITLLPSHIYSSSIDWYAHIYILQCRVHKVHTYRYIHTYMKFSFSFSVSHGHVHVF